VAKQKIEAEIDIPEGWEFVRTGSMVRGEFYLGIESNPVCAMDNYANGCIVIRRVVEYREPVLPADAHKKCEFSRDGVNWSSGILNAWVSSDRGDKCNWNCQGIGFHEHCRIEKEST
jgi:hypothetical protein